MSSRVASCTFRALLLWGSCGILAVAAVSCGGRGAESHRIHEAGADQKVHIQLGDQGPLDELTILRGTDGRFVVAGVCLFPEDTRLDVSIADSAGALIGHSEVVVAHALIQSLPLGPSATGPPGPPKRYKVELSATFVPGLQPEPVLRAIGDGKQFRGEGMTRTQQGRLAYDRLFQVRL